MMSGISLGIAQRAIDELVALAPQKRRPFNPAASVAEDPHLQIELARTETRVRGAKAYLLDSIGCAWDTACNGDVPSNTQLATIQMAMLDGLDSGTVAVDLALRAGGASSVYSHQPIQRCFRDLHTAAQHAAFSMQGAANYGRSRFGLDQQTA
jgi:alkylation response protein AidB-like acyl-CoA dehydrogenase